MHGPPAVITFRNDDELVRAFEALGVTEGNRTAVIKAAILAYAAAKGHERGDFADELHKVRQELDEISHRLGTYLGVTA